jgi:hypothetical protein
MKKGLLFLAVAMWALPALAATDTFKDTIDGSMDIYDTEGYAAGGGSATFRLNKENQHMGFMDWDGSVGQTSGQSMADFVTNNGGLINSAYLWVKAETSLSNLAAIVTIRTSNVGNIVEDTLGCCADYLGLNGPDGVDIATIGGKSEPVAFRMADPYLANPARYANQGEGIDQGGVGQYPGEPWKRPTTGNPAGTSSGGVTFYPGSDMDVLVGASRRGFWGDEIYGFEGVIGSTWSKASNTVSLFENAGQLVNKDSGGNFLFLGPGDAQTDGWYKVAINPELVYDIILNDENKGLVFTGYVPNGGGYGNESVYSHRDSVANAPYLEIEVVPEPATMVLLALGGVALLRRRTA